MKIIDFAWPDMKAVAGDVSVHDMSHKFNCYVMRASHFEPEVANSSQPHIHLARGLSENMWESE